MTIAAIKVPMKNMFLCPAANTENITTLVQKTSSIGNYALFRGLHSPKNPGSASKTWHKKCLQNNNYVFDEVYLMDRNWLLNPNAIKAAKSCIQLVESELGVKLKLSHPNFLDLLYDYCELTESEDLTRAFKLLVSMAGTEVKKELVKSHTQNKVTPIKKFDETASIAMPIEESNSSNETIEYNGRNYQRWKDGLEFKGLYRGQPRYA